MDLSIPQKTSHNGTDKSVPYEVGGVPIASTKHNLYSHKILKFQTISFRFA